MSWEAITFSGISGAIGGALFNLVITLVGLVTSRFTWPLSNMLWGALIGLALGAILGALMGDSGSWGRFPWWLFAGAAVVIGLGLVVMDIRRRKMREE